MSHPRWSWLFGGALVFGVTTAIALIPISRAAQVPTFDMNSARTRLITSNALEGLYLCPNPFYIQVPNQSTAPQKSFSSPVVITTGGLPTIYQYSYTARTTTTKSNGTWGTANLWVLNTPAESLVTQGSFACPTTDQVFTNQTAQDFSFDPGIGTEAANTVGGDTLNQAKTVSAPTISPGYVSSSYTIPPYVAIGMGKYLYSWPLSGTPANGLRKPIFGNPNDSINQVDDSPVITPPLPATGTNSNGLTKHFTSPYAFVGSWNGGFTGYAIDPPAGVSPTVENWTTGSQKAFITSSPTWNSHDNQVYFGVSTAVSDTLSTSQAQAAGVTDANAPRVIAWNPVTAKVANVIGGLGTYPHQIRYSVDSSVAVGASGNIYVPDQQGDVYKYSPSGTFLAETTAGYVSPKATNISNLAVSSSGVYASGNGLIRLFKFNPSNLATIWDQVPPGSANMYSPSIVEANGQDEVFVSTGDHLYGYSATGQRYSTTTFQTAPYAAIVPDAGSGTGTPRYFFSWVSSDPNGVGAVEGWIALPYTIVNATLQVPGGTDGQSLPSNPITAQIPENDTQSLTATVTVPPHSTASVVGQWSSGEPQTSPSFSATKDDIGSTFPLRSVKPGVWQAVFSLSDPILDTPGTYYLNFGATSSLGNGLTPLTNSSGQNTSMTSVQSITVDVTSVSQPQPISTCTTACGPVQINPITPPSSVAANGDLTFQAYGESNLTHPHPYPTADLGDTVVVTLTVPQSQIQLGPNETLDQAYLTKATLIYPHGTIVQTGLAAEPNYVEQINSLTQPMLIKGLSATRTIFENWAGFPPPQPPATNDGMYSLEAKWTAKVVYTLTSHPQICPKPEPPGSSIDLAKCTTTTQTQQETSTISHISYANMVITGTDWYIIPVAIDSGTQ